MGICCCKKKKVVPVPLPRPVQPVAQPPPLPTLKLIYFPYNGSAEHIRLIFIAAGVRYDEPPVVGSSWAELKPTLPISTVPLLEIHGRIIMNMSTIAHEVGVECGLAGAKYIHGAQASGIAQSAVDLKENCLMPIVYEKDEKRKEQRMQTFQDEVLPQRLQLLSDLLGNEYYFVAGQLTYADVVVFSILDQLCNSDPRFVATIDEFPRLRAFYQRICQLPNVAQYLMTRPRKSLLSIYHHTIPVAQNLNDQRMDRQVAGLTETTVEDSIIVVAPAAAAGAGNSSSSA